MPTAEEMDCPPYESCAVCEMESEANGDCQNRDCPRNSPVAGTPAATDRDVDEASLDSVDSYLSWRASHLRSMGRAYDDDAALVDKQLAAFRGLRRLCHARLEAAELERDFLAETARRLTAQRDAALERVTEYGDAIAYLELAASTGGVVQIRRPGAATLLTTRVAAAAVDVMVAAPTLLECVERTRRVRAVEAETEGGR